MSTFNREDLGVYVTLTIFGAGVGLIIGAFIEARMNGVDEYEQETFAETQSKTKAGNKKTTRKSEVGHEEEIVVVEVRGGEKAKMGKNKRKEGAQEKSIIEELDAFSALYEVSSIQRGLVISGVLSIKDLERQLQAHDHVDYTKAFVNDDGEVKGSSEMSGGFSSERRSDEDVKFNKQFIYFSEDEMVMRIVTDGRMILITDPDDALWPGVIDDAIQASDELQAATVYAYIEGENTQYAITISDSAYPEYDGSDSETRRRPYNIMEEYDE